MSYLTTQRAHVFCFVIQKYAVLSLYALAFSIYEDNANLEEGELEKKMLEERLSYLICTGNTKRGDLSSWLYLSILCDIKQVAE